MKNLIRFSLMVGCVGCLVFSSSCKKKEEVTGTGTQDTGAIALLSTPSGASVFLNGIDTGQVTPDTLTDVWRECRRP